MHTRISLYISDAEKLWLTQRAEERGEPVSLQIASLVREAMVRDPLQIYVHECRTKEGVFFCASVGESGDDFYEGESRKAAFRAAEGKAKKLGLSKLDIRFRIVEFAAKDIRAGT